MSGLNILDQVKELMSNGHTYSSIAKVINKSKWHVMQLCRSNGIKSNAGDNYTQQEKDELTALSATDDINQKNKLINVIQHRWAKEAYIENVSKIVSCASLDDLLQSEYVNLITSGSNCCNRCGGSIEHCYVNFVDGNPNNILLSNIEILCSDCHTQVNSNSLTPYTTVTSTFRFDAAHYLPNHSKKCKFLHGHSYKLEVTVRRKVDVETGMVIDFGKLKSVVRAQVEEVLDHGYINNFVSMPTSENIIMWIWAQLSMDIKGLHKLRLYETENNYSELCESDVLNLVINNMMNNKLISKEQVLEEYEEYKVKQEVIKSLKSE